MSNQKLFEILKEELPTHTVELIQSFDPETNRHGQCVLVDGTIALSVAYEGEIRESTLQQFRQLITQGTP